MCFSFAVVVVFCNCVYVRVLKDVVRGRIVDGRCRDGGPVNPLAPNDVYIRRTAQLTSRRCILNIYSTNILTEHFKHAAYSPFFFFSRCRLFHNATFFSYCNIHILNTRCAKI